MCIRDSNPTVDLKDVKKEVLLLYIAHLDTEIRARDISIDKLTDTFEKTIVNLTEKCTNSVNDSVIQKLDELALPKKDSGDKNSNNNVSQEDSTSTTIEPFKSLTESFLDKETYDKLSEYISQIDYKTVGDQKLQKPNLKSV